MIDDDNPKLKERGGGIRFVYANWNPDNGRLNVNANDPDKSNPNLGCRLSRRFFTYSSITDYIFFD